MQFCPHAIICICNKKIKVHMKPTSKERNLIYILIGKLNSDKMLHKYILKLNVQISATLEFYRYLINSVILHPTNFLLHIRHMFT